MYVAPKALEWMVGSTRGRSSLFLKMESNGGDLIDGEKRQRPRRRRRREGTEVERKWIHQCTRGEHDTGPRDTKLSVDT